MQPKRRPSATISSRGRRDPRSRLGIESLEGRALLSLTPIDFAATITSPPVAMGGAL